MPSLFLYVLGTSVCSADVEDNIMPRTCLNCLYMYMTPQALEEPSFSIAYANLCKVLSPLKVEYEDNGKIKQTNFRRELLTKCQVGVVWGM